MIGTIRKHSTWLWAIVITVTIISFVVFFSPTSKMSGGGGSENYGSINGRRISRDELVNIHREVDLLYFLNTGNWPDFDDQQRNIETYRRLFLVRKQEELGIQPGTEAVARTAANILRQMGRDKPVPLDVFASQVLQPRGLTATDFSRFIRHDLGIQQLVAAAGLGGKLVTPQEISALYERENVEMSAQAVFFSASNHLDEVTPAPEDIARFYTNQMAKYRLPDRVQVTYVRFPASNFQAEAEQELTQAGNFEERIETTYQKLGGTNYFREAKSPEEAKQTIRDRLIMEGALKRSQKQAYEFANELYGINPASAENLGKLAAKKNLSAQLGEPFDRQFPPADLKVNQDFVKKAFALTDDEPFTEPIIGEDAVFVIAINKKLPSEIPRLEQIRKQVTTDYIFSRAVLLARQAGSSFAATLAAGMPNGKSFSSICTQVKVQPILLPPFSLSTRLLPQVEQHTTFVRFKQAAFGITPGKASEFAETGEGGFVVFVQSKLPIDQAKMKAELPQYASYVRRARENEAFNDWLRREAERGLRDTPIARRQPVAGTAPPE